MKHPILLSRKHKLTKLILQQKHLKLLHAGPQLLLFTVRSNFWITNGHNLEKGFVHECIHCFKASPRTVTPLMGNLPSNRIQPAHPFLISGTDLTTETFLATLNRFIARREKSSDLYSDICRSK